METYPIQVKPLAADLSTESGVQSVISGTEDLDVGLLVNNAGIGLHGSFFRDAPEKHAQMIAVNVTAVTTLAHAFGRRLALKRRGGIIFTSSMATGGVPWFASYSSTKSYVSTLAGLLRRELAERGVSVLCLEPGFVKSEMQSGVMADMDLDKVSIYVMEAEDCVKEAVKCLYDGKAKVTPGLVNKIMVAVFAWFPQWMKWSVSDMTLSASMKKEVRSFPES